ncbi:MAG TPA: DUF885 domain-containing protein [Steroidobacteraceae bacterium]|nr:DUF885 domain-containing protein [Steroidobacteraceae bacterium]
MNRSLTTLLVGALSIASTAQAAEAAWITESNRHTQVLLEVNARYQPESAADLGLTQYDRLIIDLKPKFDERFEADLAAAITQLETVRAQVKDDRASQDLDILIKAAQRQAATSALNRRLMIPYFDLGKQIYGSFQDMLDARVDKKRQPAALVRLKRYAGTERGYEPITKLARARIEERMNDSSLTWPWVVEVQQNLDNAPQYIDGMRDLLKKSGLSGWQKDFDALTRELKAHNDWVRSVVLPRARQTNRLPPEIYADNLKSFGVEADPRDLIQRAMFAYLQTRDEMDSLARIYAAQKGLKSSNYRDVIRELKKSRVAGDQVLPVYKAHLAQLEETLRAQNIVTLPKRAAVIRLSTEAEAAAQPAPHIDPPRLIGNTGEPAEFVLPLKNAQGGEMDDFDSGAISWTITAHECRPGHELQFAGMLESGVSTARIVYAFNSANVEGWALYAEAVMKQYLPIDGQIGALQMRMLRAARAYLDPMLNLGLIEPDAAKRVLTEEVMLSDAFAKSEIDRYTFNSPGQATSYFYGYSHLEALRTRVEIALGAKFKEQPYHDFIINEGLLPLDLLEQAVMTRFVPSQK